MQDSYQYTSQKGDVVRMPNGMTGTIVECDIVCGGHFKIVRVRPDVHWLRRLFLRIFERTWFYDDQINRLVPLKLSPRM